jgi:CBS domain-containing protein
MVQEQRTLRREEDEVKALFIINQTGARRLMVVDKGRLVSIIALKDLLQFLSFRVKLED